MSDENEDIDVSNTSIPQIQPKKKKPFVMVKSGIDTKNLSNKDEDAYVKNLLSDKNLIEEDIVLNRPNLANLNTDLMSNSGSSVVITPTNNNESNSQNDLNYSDSDFESNLIDRLDNTADLSSSSSEYDSDQIVVLDPLNISDEEDMNTISSDDEEILPVNPATLDKKLFYAVHKFLGPESSHCPLKKNEECIVLNDEDVYWWLVRRNRDGRIGFVPGEILEGWNDKLARWNAFINERQSKEGKDEIDDSPINEDHSKSSLVKFDANVTYVPYNSTESVYSGSLHEIGPVDEDELKSDISWGSMPKLQIKKNGNTNSVKKQLNIDKIINKQEDIPQWSPSKPSFGRESPSGSIGDYSTSELNSDSSVYEDSQSSSDDNILHDDVSREYTPILGKIDDLVNLLS
ncbi:hypothetical protein ACO0R3_000049 [Hanseniaspora guilliermondii]